ncbi:MAG: hypothetical protein WDW36_007994 [Sanguina aurantia]
MPFRLALTAALTLAFSLEHSSVTCATFPLETSLTAPVATSACKAWRDTTQSANYTWFTTSSVRDDSQIYPGDQSRLRGAIRRFQNGGNLSIGFLGGSLTAGFGKNDAYNYVEWTSMILEAHLGPRVKVFNGGLGGAPSSYMEVCSKMHIPVYADIIVAEFNVNDESNPSPPVDNVARRSFERMLRKLLDYPNKPAVIILNAFRWFKTFSGETPYDGQYHHPSAEKDFNELAAYYRLPVLSVRSACYHLIAAGVEGYRVDECRSVQCGNHNLYNDDTRPARNKGHVFYNDGVHPDGNTGYRAMGEFVTQLILDAAASIAQGPDTKFFDEQASLTPPTKDGWAWTDEGRGGTHKLGFVTLEPGRVLRCRLDMTPPAMSDRTESRAVFAELAILKSYEHMGKATVTCEGGCTCEPTALNGAHELKQSIIVMEKVMLSSTGQGDCSLVITTTKESDSGEHKFKVLAVIVSEASASSGFWMHNQLGSAMMDGQVNGIE